MNFSHQCILLFMESPLVYQNCKSKIPNLGWVVISLPELTRLASNDSLGVRIHTPLLDSLYLYDWLHGD